MMPIFVNTSAKATRGFSLVEMLVGLAIMAIAMGVMAGYLSSISSQERILMQRAGATAIDNNLQNLLQSTSQHCTGNIKAAHITVPTGAVNAGPFNIACPSGCPMSFLSYYKADGTIGQPALYTGAQPDGSGINIASVQLQNVTATGISGQYSANLVVNYGGTPPAPPAASIPIQLSASTSGGTDTLQSCSTGSCAANFTPVGGTGGGETFCISTHAQPAANFYLAEANCVHGATLAHLCTQTEWQEACLWDQPSPYGPYGDGGPKLRLGEEVTGNNPDEGPSTAEWVSNLTLYNDSNGGQWNGTIMGGAGADITPSHADQCSAFGQFKTYEFYPTPQYVYGYRCCYKP